MTESKTSEAQKRATQAYREKMRKQSAKSAAKTYINKYSNLDNITELKQLIASREKELQSE